MRTRKQKNTRESTVRVRSTLRLSGVLGILGILIGLCWEWNGVSKGALAAALFFLIAAAFEFWASPREKACSTKSVKQKQHRILEPADSFGFELVDADGDIWRERKVAIGGESVTLRLPKEIESYTRALQFARTIIEDPERIASEFHEFKQTAAAHISAEDVKDLVIDCFEFFGRKNPEIAEVLFRPTSSGRFWVAIYTNGEFRNLLEET